MTEAVSKEAILTPPLARRSPQTRTHQGWTLTDDYTWLQNKNDPEVIAYLEAENAYARATLRHTEALQEQLFQEMRGRMKEDDSSAPERRGDYWYYVRVAAGQQYRIFCRKLETLDAPEEILLDENILAAGYAYCRVRLFEPSPDHTLLAYSVDRSGNLVYDLYIVDLRSGELLAGPITDCAWTAAWADDNSTLYYTLFDAIHRSDRLLYHRVGDTIQDETGQGKQGKLDKEIYRETDGTFGVTISRTRSGKFLLLTLASHSSSEVHYLPIDQPTGDFQIIHPRQPWMEYYVDHHGEHFLIRTNEGAENFKLMAAPIASPSKTHWDEIIPHRADTLLESFATFRNHLVIYERRNGLQQIRISDPDGISNVHSVIFPEPVYTVWADSLWDQQTNFEFDTAILRFYYSSLVTPDSTVDYDMVRRTWEVKKQQEIPSGYDPTHYESLRLFATAADGTQVPISLVYRKELRQEGGNSLLLIGYGAYGYSYDPSFHVEVLSLLDRGFIFAIAHIRGGSELGRSWYEQGRLMHKLNTFTDFIACAEHLIALGYTTPDLLAITGASAGGLLMGAVINMRPDLCKAVVARVPFTNVISAALMPELPLTIEEYEQWGHPDDADAFAYMLSYSPYENVATQPYPHILATGGLNDLQVPYWDPAKWVAKLRTHKTDSNRLLLVTIMEAGHGGASGRYDHLHERAEIYAFLIDTLSNSA